MVRVFLVLEVGLKKNFSDVSVSVVDCPDLTKSPFNLAAAGRQLDDTEFMSSARMSVLDKITK